MAINKEPIFPGTPAIQWATTAVKTANTAKDGTGTVSTIFTANATNGSRVDYIRLRPLGSNVATVVRLFINNGSDSTVAANNILFAERTLSATTLSEVAELLDVTIAVNVSLPPGYKITATVGTTVSTGYAVCAVGGDY